MSDTDQSNIYLGVIGQFYRARTLSHRNALCVVVGAQAQLVLLFRNTMVALSRLQWCIR